MQKIMHWFVSLFCLMIMLVIVVGKEDENSDVKGIIGAIIDDSSRIGKEGNVAIKMALENFSHYTNQSFVLHIMNSQGDPLQAAFAVRDLIDKQKVQAIVGPQTWEETSLVAAICSQKSIPVLSLAEATPKWATNKWPYLVQTSANQFMQMEAVAAIVQSWEWYQVSVIYGDTDSLSTRGLAHLSGALKEVGAKIRNFVAIQPTISSSLMSIELEKLKEGECRVFIVHLSFPLALHLFEIAKKINMIEKDYVWITTDPFTSLFHSLNASTISSLQGIVGVKSYFPQIGHQFENFDSRFRQKFSLANPHEFSHEPGIFAAQAYDAAWTLALAMRETNNKGGQALLDKVLLNNFTGLSGNIRFKDHKLAPAHIFQIMNVMKEGYREIGFWSNGLDFSTDIGQNATYNSSMKELGQVFWPGGPLYTPRGWTLPSIAKPLRIGVPNSSVKQFVNIVYDKSQNKTIFEGFAIELFKRTVALLPFHLPYEFFAFPSGTLDDLVEQIYLKNYDAVVGDVSIVENRQEFAEFTEPYTLPGLVMVVPLQSKEGSKAWLFLKPFTKTMWILIGATIIYNSFALWMIEKKHNPELNGSVLNQTGSMMWLVFSTFVSLHGEKLHSNLSRTIMVVWLFVALTITQTYTANLASMLTIERLEPAFQNVDQLRNSHAMVGHLIGSYLSKYLQKVLHFHPENIKQFESLEEYAEALRMKEIAAAFLSAPRAKVFLAMYCNEFVQAGPMYKMGGYGFAFPKGSPLLPSLNKALLEVSESGQLRDLENKMLVAKECLDEEIPGEDKKTTSLHPNSFWALFTFTACTSTIALLSYIFQNTDSIRRKTSIQKIMVAMVRYWRSQRRRFSRRVSNTDSPTDSPKIFDLPTPS